MTAAINIILFCLSILNGFFKRVLRFCYIKWWTPLFLPVKECYQTVFLDLSAPLMGEDWLSSVKAARRPTTVVHGHAQP